MVSEKTTGNILNIVITLKLTDVDLDLTNAWTMILIIYIGN